MVETRVWRNFDFIMLATVLILIGFGIVMIQSATLGFGGTRFGLGDFALHQAVYAMVGLVLLFVLASVDYSLFESFTIPIYLINIALLVAVFFIGRGAFGSTRWIDLGFFPLQPSELAKIFTILTLSKFLADRKKDIRGLHHFIFSIVLVLIPMGLVYSQPDLGTALVIAVAWVGLILTVRTRRVYLIGLLAVTAPAMIGAWRFVLKGYMRDRLLIFLHPEQDPLGQGYNIIQAKISIGSGGWFGQGFGHGMQSQLHFLRVQHTDFIFSVTAEEFGFLGIIALFALLMVLLWRIVRVAGLAGDAYGQLIAVGVGSMLFFQIFVNIGMNLQLMPVTGIPLPFISYGGSSLITVLMGLGILQSVVMRHKKIAFVSKTFGDGS